MPQGAHPLLQEENSICFLIHHISHSFVGNVRREMGRCALQAFGCCQLPKKNWE